VVAQVLKLQLSSAHQSTSGWCEQYRKDNQAAFIYGFFPHERQD